MYVRGGGKRGARSIGGSENFSPFLSLFLSLRDERGRDKGAKSYREIKRRHERIVAFTGKVNSRFVAIRFDGMTLEVTSEKCKNPGATRGRVNAIRNKSARRRAKCNINDQRTTDKCIAVFDIATNSALHLAIRLINMHSA